MKKQLTLAEFVARGGKARWKGTTKKQRSIAMKKVRAASKKLIPNKQARESLDEQAQEV